MRKILYSPGYGAGWSSWCGGDRDMAKYMLEYQPIIDYLENGGKFGRDECELIVEDGEIFCDNLHPLLRKLAEDCEERFGETPYMGGARDLKVAEVSGLVRIEEHDGYESYHESYDDWL